MRDLPITPRPDVAASGPNIVVDGSGLEVGALLTFEAYRDLMRLIRLRIAEGDLPAYWRRALEDCIEATAVPDDSESSSRRSPPPREATATTTADRLVTSSASGSASA